MLTKHPKNASMVPYCTVNKNGHWPLQFAQKQLISTLLLKTRLDVENCLNNMEHYGIPDIIAF